MLLLLAIEACILTGEASSDSATVDEVAHFAAALEHWRDGRFEMYRVNPPLVRLIAMSVVAAQRPELDPKASLGNRGAIPRPEFTAGMILAGELGPEYFHLLAIARWTCIPLSLVGGWFCFRWAEILWGTKPGLVSLALWVFSPTTLAYGHLITPDMGAAAIGVFAAFQFRRWLVAPTWGGAAVAGIALGLTALTKTTWLLLFGLWPALWIFCRLLQQVRPSLQQWGRQAMHIVALLVLAVWVINAGYGFEASLEPLGNYRFVSHAFSGGTSVESDAGLTVGNRFARSWLRGVPVPVPRDYLLGVDFLRMEYERKYWSYLDGSWRLGGWWYYYLYAMLTKEPLGTWGVGLAAISCVLVVRRAYTARSREELLLLAPAVAVLAAVSSQTGFNHHLRYVLPAYPFLFILLGRVGKSFELGHRRVAVGVGLLLGWSIVSSLSVFPHSMSYFNELAGGPKRGHWHLGNSNADWGQDLLYLKTWYVKHPEARPLRLGYDQPFIDPRMLDIDAQKVPAGSSDDRAAPEPAEELGPKPGWYAVSVNWLHDREHRYDYFNDLEPVDWVGYTMPVYHISLEQANALRRRYGMAELPNDSEAPPATVPAVPATRVGPGG